MESIGTVYCVYEGTHDAVCIGRTTSHETAQAICAFQKEAQKRLGWQEPLFIIEEYLFSNPDQTTIKDIYIDLAKSQIQDIVERLRDKRTDARILVFDNSNPLSDGAKNCLLVCDTDVNRGVQRAAQWIEEEIKNNRYPKDAVVPDTNKMKQWIYSQ